MFMCCTDVWLKSQPEKKVCLALLAHAGIIVLRSPALLSSKRSGHCVFVGTITGLLWHKNFLRIVCSLSHDFLLLLLIVC